jgi:hypothetical protein
MYFRTGILLVHLQLNTGNGRIKKYRIIFGSLEILFYICIDFKTNRTMSKLMRHFETGDYNYLFNWMDEDGNSTGFNDVWAPNMAEARKRAKEMETKAGWRLYDEVKREYVTIPEEVNGQGHCFRNKGMYINPKSFRKATYKSSAEMDRIANMLTC